MTTESPGNRTDVDKALLGHSTYRSLGEQRLSPKEERFEKGRRTIGLFLAPVIAIVFLACRSTWNRTSRRWPACCSA